jgi:hypothetical protein
MGNKNIRKVMDWIQVLTLFFANVGLIIWFRAESRNDWRHMDARLHSFQLDTQAQLQAIQTDMKDFHGRLERQDAQFKIHLLEIEERRRK